MRAEEKLLKTEEVAEATGRAIQTLANDRHKCQGIPYIKLNRSVRYRQSDVEIYIQQHRIDPLQSSK